MRFLVSGPVSVHSCLPIGPKRGRRPRFLVGGSTVEYPARAELGLELGILGIVRMLRLLLGVEVIEVAVELVEAVNRGQILVAIT